MSNILRGSIMNPEVIRGKSAYEIAVMHGFEGTEEEWVESLHDDAKAKRAEEAAVDARQSANEAQTANTSATAEAQRAKTEADRAEQAASTATALVEENSESAAQAATAKADEVIAQRVAELGTIVQTTGDSTTAVMSQKAVTENLEAHERRFSVVEQSAINSGTVVQLSEAYTARETANGANIVDCAETTLKTIKGDTVSVDNVLKSTTIEKIISTGRNLFEGGWSTATHNGITYTKNADKSIDVSGMATNKSYFTLASFTKEKLPTGYYAVSGNITHVVFTIAARMGSTWVKDVLNGQGMFYLDWNGYDKIEVKLYVYTGYTPNGTIYPMLNCGCNPMPFEPYTENEFALPSKITLQKYDYIDFAAEKIVRHSKAFNPKQASNIAANGSTASNTFRFGYATSTACVAGEIVCSHYATYSTLSACLSAGSGIVVYNNGYVEIVDNRYTTVADFKAYLEEQIANGTPVTFIIHAETAIAEEAIELSNDSYIAYKNGLEIISGNDNAQYGAIITTEQSYCLSKDENTRPPVITFIDDDGTPESLANWELIGDAAGIQNTLALVTSREDMDWDEVERLQNKGFEFVSHTHTHLALDTNTEEALIADFKASITALREHGCESRYLVYPYNWVDADGMEVIKKHFRAGIWGEEKINTIPIKPHELTRFSVLKQNADRVEKTINGVTRSVQPFKTLDEFKAIIDMAVAAKGWVIFMSHLFTNETSGYYCDDEVRNLFVEVIKYAARNGAKIETFGRAFEMFKNNISVGSITENSHCVVDCDGKVFAK